MKQEVEMTNDGFTLFRKGTNIEVGAGDEVVSFRGDKATVRGGTPPRDEGSSTGRVYVQWATQRVGTEYYPSVFGLEWRRA
jgi:hypothetical protein